MRSPIFMVAAMLGLGIAAAIGACGSSVNETNAAGGTSGAGGSTTASPSSHAISVSASVSSVASSSSSGAGTTFYCVEDGGALDAGCTCEFKGSVPQGACSPDGIQCGHGCAPNCTCVEGEWHCIAPPC